MNYKKIYFQIIKNRINNPLPLDAYSEVHHIIPRSFGGGNHKENLVRLTAREHFLVHFLLYKMYKHRSKVIFSKSKKEAERYKKMAYAFNLMLRVKSKQNSYINSHVFEKIKKDINLQYAKYPKKQIKKMFDFYVKYNIDKETMCVLNQHFNTTLSLRAVRMLFCRNGLVPSKFMLVKKGGVKKYSDEQLKNMYDFVIEKNITSKTVNIFNKKFNTNFKYHSLKSLFNKRGYKLTDSKTYVVDKNVAVKYPKKMVEKMFHFYLDNNLNIKTIDILNQEFNTSFTHKNFLAILRKHNFCLQKTKRYNPSEVKQWFDFYVKNNIKKSNLHIFNDFFDTDFTVANLRATFYNHGYRIKNNVNGG